MAVSLGIFAIPELVDLVVEGGSIATAGASAEGIRSGREKWVGVRDTLRNWLLVIRSSIVGVFVGFIPGLGATVVDWLAYGLAKQVSKDSGKFGTGDVRGVIAVDAASNSNGGGALVTTLAFGVPGSVTMAQLLAAFQIHDLVPGPLMLTTQLSVTLTLVWSLVLANLFGAGICFLLVSQIARVSMIRIHRIFPHTDDGYFSWRVSGKAGVRGPDYACGFRRARMVHETGRLAPPSSHSGPYSGQYHSGSAISLDRQIWRSLDFASPSALSCPSQHSQRDLRYSFST